MLLVCLGSLVVRLSWVKEGENNRQSELFGKEKMERERERGTEEREREREREDSMYFPPLTLFLIEYCNSSWYKNFYFTESINSELQQFVLLIYSVFFSFLFFPPSFGMTLQTLF